MANVLLCERRRRSVGPYSTGKLVDNPVQYLDTTSWGKASQ